MDVFYLWWVIYSVFRTVKRIVGSFSVLVILSTRLHYASNVEGERKLFQLHICPWQIHQQQRCGHATDFSNYTKPCVWPRRYSVCHVCDTHCIISKHSNGIFIWLWLDFLFFNCLIIFNWILSQNTFLSYFWNHTI